jgi:hypothetical protein
MADDIGTDLLSYGNLFDWDDWIIEERGIETDDYGPMVVLVTQRRMGDSQRWAVGYWLEVGNIWLTNPYLAKLAEIPALLQGRLEARLRYAFTACDETSCDDAREAVIRRLNLERSRLEARRNQG